LADQEIINWMQYQSEIYSIYQSVLQNCYLLLDHSLKNGFFSQIISLPPLFKGATASSLAHK